MENKNVLVVGFLVLAVIISGVVSVNKALDVSRANTSDAFGTLTQVQRGSGSDTVGAASLTYSAARSSQELYNYLEALTADTNALRVPLAGVISATGSFAFGTITTSSASSTAITTTGAVAGDLVLVSVATSSTAGFTAYGYVSGNGTTTVNVAPTGAASVSLGTPTITVRVFPAASFAAPATLTAATTTAANR